MSRVQIPTEAEARELEADAQDEFELMLDLRSGGWGPPIFAGRFDPYKYDMLFEFEPCMLFDLEPLEDYYANAQL